MAALQARNLSKRYGEIDVIHDVDLDIRDGEFVVFVGPSGCGKSTLLRMIAGLEDITGGDLHIGTRRVNDIAPAKRGIAMVFQSYALYPHMNLYDNMAFGLKLAGQSKEDVDRAVRDAARILRIDHLLDRKPRQLSGGQRQRVAIGRAITRRPDVFLFDEPLSNLDAELRVKMRLEFARLHDELKTTMIYVTHDQVEAMTLADKIVVLSAGRIEQVGSPDTLYHAPANRFVAGFIGSPKMNFLSAHVDTIGIDGMVAILPSGQRFRASVLAEGADGRARLSPGMPVTLGVRPEHLRLAADDALSGPGDASTWMAARSTVVESLGDVAYLYADAENAADAPDGLIVRVAARTQYSRNTALRLTADAEHVHVFDADGLALPRAMQNQRHAA